MKKVIGYKWEIISDNGLFCENWREEHIESPIYLTEEEAIKAVAKTKNASLKQFELQKERRLKESRYTLEEIHGMYTSMCKWLDSLEEKISIVPIYAYDEATDEYRQFNIGD